MSPYRLVVFRLSGWSSDPGDSVSGSAGETQSQRRGKSHALGLGGDFSELFGCGSRRTGLAERTGHPAPSRHLHSKVSQFLMFIATHRTYDFSMKSRVRSSHYTPRRLKSFMLYYHDRKIENIVIEKGLNDAV